MLVFLLMPVFLYLVILIPGVQNYIAGNLTETLSQKLGTEVHFSQIRIHPIKKIVIDDFLVKDKNHDTLIYVKQINSTIDSLSWQNKKIYLGRITANEICGNILKDEEHNNYQFIIDSLKSKSESKTEWAFNTNEIWIRNSSLSYNNQNKPITPNLFNPNHLEINKFSLVIDKLNLISDSITFRVKKLSFSDYSGIQVNSFKCEAGYGSKGIHIKNLRLQLDESYLALDYFRVKFDSLSDFNDLWNKPQFELKINSLSTSAHDIHFFVTKAPDFKYNINIKGNFSGNLNNLVGNNIHINAGEGTSLQTNFQIQDLSNLDNSYLYLNVKKLVTTPVDIKKLLAYNNDTKEYNLDNLFDNLGNIEYKGNFSGFINNMVAYGTFTTDLGSISTDLGIKTSDEHKIIYAGYIDTQSFNVGKIMKSERNLNNVSMSLSVNGYRGIDNKYRAYINGTLDSVDINNYRYNKAILTGYLSNDKFNGSAKLNDPNAQIDFNGQVDFSNIIPEVDFIAGIHKVNLKALNIAPKLNIDDIELNLKATLNGESFNTLSGNILLYDGYVRNKEDEFKLDTLTISSLQIDSTQIITIDSEIIDGEFKGNYSLGSILREMQEYAHQSLPSVVNTPIKKDTYNNNLEFSFTTKKLSRLLNIISPNFNIADGSTLDGVFSSKEKNAKINGSFKSISYNNLKGDTLQFEVNLKNDYVKSFISCSELSLASKVAVDNFNLMQKAEGDSMTLNLFWNDWQEKNNSGAIYTNTYFNRLSPEELFTTIKILPSKTIINDSVWTIQESDLYLMPNGINFNTFRIHHLNQEININGVLADNDADFEINFQNINLKELSAVQKSKKISLGGILNAGITVKNSLKSPIIGSNIKLDTLVVNSELVGNLSAQSAWDKDEKKVITNASILKNDKVILDGDGYFKPKDKDFSFDFQLDSLPVGFLDIYLSKVMQNIRGTASGHLGLRNTNPGLGLEGQLKLNHAKFNVDLLQCSYFIDDSINFVPDKITFLNNTLTDIDGNKGAFYGNIKHTNFYNMEYDLTLKANEMLLLNTKEKDNDRYYGTVYGSGTLLVSGTTYNMNINISGKNEKNTQLYIPLQDRSESLKNSFIQFYNPDTTIETDLNTTPELYVAERNNYNLSMDLEFTPEAEVQVIFDPTVGDLLKSTGKGELQINMNRDKDITFFGEYTASGGEYFFSLENIVNKRFSINDGGTIVWQGDPYDAIVNLKATYKLKTSIAPLTQQYVGDISGESSRRVPVNCDLILGDRLTQPSIRFEINAPTLDQTNQNLIKDAISTEEELNRQVLSLLVLNKFYVPEYYANAGIQNQGVSNVAIANTSEVLSSQLSNWLSQISNDFDIGVAYRPEDEISREEIEVALSTQIFNNRVTLNGNVEYGRYSEETTTTQNASNIVGDFDMDVKINKSGSLRAKAYTRSNDDFSYDSSPTTQGVGISYQEDFNSFGELFTKYWRIIFGKGKQEEEPNPKDDNR